MSTGKHSGSATAATNIRRMHKKSAEMVVKNEIVSQRTKCQLCYSCICCTFPYIIRTYICSFVSYAASRALVCINCACICNYMGLLWRKKN